MFLSRRKLQRRRYCSSLEYNVPEDGTYSFIVYGDWCSGDSVAYEIGAAVQ